ncbi:MAG: CPBP family intramembrane metalloprotease [Planctomycetes bacterium]|nr:CPBP family intramembrane metalloprotease [Planctomycetota bacterium]
MSTASAAGGLSLGRGQGPATARAPGQEVALERSLALGWLAVVPLVVAYEVALALEPGAARNTAEFLISLPFEALLTRPAPARWTLEAVATAAAAWSVFRVELGLVRRVARVGLEGLGAAALLGPALLLLLSLLQVAPPEIGRPGAVTTPADAARFAGGAAFEEVVFRAASLCALGLAARWTLEWFLGAPRLARVLAEGAALAGSALLFAAAHLDVVVGLVAPGGEPYDGARFAWRALAGLALALLFRWRGMGVAAWCHAFFNLALALGAGPEVFL